LSLALKPFGAAVGAALAAILLEFGTEIVGAALAAICFPNSVQHQAIQRILIDLCNQAGSHRNRDYVTAGIQKRLVTAQGTLMISRLP
jgi:hypothetical protein